MSSDNKKIFIDLNCDITKTPNPSPTVTRTQTRTPKTTRTPTRSLTPNKTPTITITKSITPTITQTNTITPTVTPTQSLTPTITPTITVTRTNTPTRTITKTVSISKVIGSAVILDINNGSFSNEFFYKIYQVFNSESINIGEEFILQYDDINFRDSPIADWSKAQWKNLLATRSATKLSPYKLFEFSNDLMYSGYYGFRAISKDGSKKSQEVILYLSPNTVFIESNTPTPTATPTPTNTATNTVTPTNTITPTISITPGLSATPTITSTATNTPTNTVTPTLSITQTPSKSRPVEPPPPPPESDFIVQDVIIQPGNGCIYAEWSLPKNTNGLIGYYVFFANTLDMIWKEAAYGQKFEINDTNAGITDPDINYLKNDFLYKLKIVSHYSNRDYEYITNDIRLDPESNIYNSPDDILIKKISPSETQITWQDPKDLKIATLDCNKLYFLIIYKLIDGIYKSYDVTKFSPDKIYEINNESGEFLIEIVANYAMPNDTENDYFIKSKILKISVEAPTPTPTPTVTPTVTITPSTTDTKDQYRVKNLTVQGGNDCAYLKWAAPEKQSFTYLNKEYELFGYQVYYTSKSSFQGIDTITKSSWKTPVLQTLPIDELDCAVYNLKEVDPSSIEYKCKVATLYINSSYKQQYNLDELFLLEDSTNLIMDDEIILGIKYYVGRNFITQEDVSIDNSPSDFDITVEPGVAKLKWSGPQDKDIGTFLNFLNNYLITIYSVRKSKWLKYNDFIGNIEKYNFSLNDYLEEAGAYYFHVSAIYSKDYTAKVHSKIKYINIPPPPSPSPTPTPSATPSPFIVDTSICNVLRIKEFVQTVSQYDVNRKDISVEIVLKCFNFNNSFKIDAQRTDKYNADGSPIWPSEWTTITSVGFGEILSTSSEILRTQKVPITFIYQNQVLRFRIYTIDDYNNNRKRSLYIYTDKIPYTFTSGFIPYTIESAPNIQSVAVNSVTYDIEQPKIRSCISCDITKTPQKSPTQTKTPTRTPNVTKTLTKSITPTKTVTKSITPTRTQTRTPTNTQTPTITTTSTNTQTPTNTKTQTPSKTKPGIVSPEDYIMIFIDEASSGYVVSGHLAGTEWNGDVQLFNSLVNKGFNFNNIILFGVREADGTTSDLYPSNGLPMPISLSNIVDTPRDSVNGLTGQFIEDKMNQIWSNIPIPTQANPIRIVIYIDNSGSMNEDVVQPAVNDFITSINQKGYTTKKQLCGTERYLYWIYNTANGNVSC